MNRSAKLVILKAAKQNKNLTKEKERHMAIDRSYTKVRQNEKQSAIGLTFVWVGTVVCAPALMIGAILTTGFSLGKTLLIIGIAYLFQTFLMILNGIMASDTGYPLTVLLGKTFGEKGSRYLIASTTALFQLAQSAVQVGVCAASICAGLSTVGLTIPFWISALICGILMTLTAVFGYNSMKILSYIAVPFLAITCVIACIKSGNAFGWKELWSYQPQSNMTFSYGLGITIGGFALGTLTTTNLTRFAKSKKDVIISSLLGIVPTSIFIMGMGGFMSITSGTSDLTEIFVKLGLPISGMLALLLATWTTNTTNFYMSGMNFVRLFNLEEIKRPAVTALAGGIATIAAVLGITGYFSSIMTIFSKVFPALCGIMIADYWIIGKGKTSNWGMLPGYNWIGIVAWAIGAGFAFAFNFFSPAMNSIIVGFIAYLVLYKIFKDKLPAPKDPVEYFGTGD